MSRALLLLLLFTLPALEARAQYGERPPEEAVSTFYRRSALGAEYARRAYIEGDRGTGFTVLFTAEPLAYRRAMPSGLAFGGLLGGGIGFGGVRREVRGETKAFILRRYELTGLVGIELPTNAVVNAGLFAGVTSQGVIGTLERTAPLARLRVNTVPVRFEGNALFTKQREGSLHLIVPVPTGDFLRGKLAFGFHASRYETDVSGVANFYGFSVNAMDF